MGMNYTLHRNLCPHCGRGDEPLHIGKASLGWVFMLHVYPEHGINDLPDWISLFHAPGNVIRDEGDRVIPPHAMLATIAARYSTTPLTYDAIPFDAERGPYNLLRSRIDKHCIGRGAGTWDLVVGEFG